MRNADRKQNMINLQADVIKEQGETIDLLTQKLEGCVLTLEVCSAVLNSCMENFEEDM